MKKRAGVTRKVSLSVHEDDVKMLRERAKRLYGGNVSAVFGDLIARIRREEALDRAFAWYGKPIEMTDDERERIDRELLGERRRAPRPKRAS